MGVNFEELDQKMRRFEESLDQRILPELYLAVRLDGRNFARLTKEICQFEAPFDESFRDAMTGTTKHRMECGFRMVYGYTQSDEISLLFHREDYFAWRQEDAHRNSLNAHYYWMLRKPGFDPTRQENVVCVRSQLRTDMELKLGEQYREWVIGLLERQEP